MPAEHVVDLRLRQLEESIRFVEAAALMIREAAAGPPGTIESAAPIDAVVARLLSTVEDQLATVTALRTDIAELRIAAHGSRRRRPRT